MIGVESSSASVDKVKLFADALGVTYPLFYDESGEVSKVYALRDTSTTIILSPDFVVRERLIYRTNSETLTAAWQKHGAQAP